MPEGPQGTGELTSGSEHSTVWGIECAPFQPLWREAEWRMSLVHSAALFEKEIKTFLKGRLKSQSGLCKNYYPQIMCFTEICFSVILTALLCNIKKILLSNQLK